VQFEMKYSITKHCTLILKKGDILKTKQNTLYRF